MTPCEVCGSQQVVHVHEAPAGSQWGDTLVVRTPPEPEMPVFLSRVDYRRLVHYAQAGINLLAEPNGQTTPEPYEPNMAWLTQLEKELDG